MEEYINVLTLNQICPGEEDTTDGVLNDADRIFFAIVLLILLFFAGLSYLSLAN
jgi:hypothetical protein